jgi:hypothetical protein
MPKKLALTPASVDALSKGLLADLLAPRLAIEVLASGKERRRYRRQVAGTTVMVTLHGPSFPEQTIAAAREWARGLNEKVEAGVDPCEALREEKARASITIACAHELYLIAVREGSRPTGRRFWGDQMQFIT